MRTDRLDPVRTCAALVLGASLASMGHAADVDFNPTVTANVFYDGNVDGVGETDAGDPADEPSSIVGGVHLNLPWSIRTPSTAISLFYRPRREVYNDEARPDFTSHAAGGSMTRTISARASYSLGLDFNYSDRQELNYTDRLALEPERPLPAQTYVRRRTFQSGGLFGSGSFSAGRRSTLSWRVGARAERGDDLPADPEAGLPASEFQDSESYDAAFGWSFGYSPQGGAGVAGVVQHFSYEDGPLGPVPSVDVFSLGHTGSRRLGREGSLSYAVGALRSDDGNSTNVAGSVNVSANWTIGPHSSIATGVRQGASAGDGVSGASLDRGGYFTWAYARPRGFGASVTAAYWDRQNLNDDSGAPQPPSALTVSDSYSWRIGRYFRIGVFHSYYHQDAGSGGDATLATRYHTAGLSWTWLIRGERG